MSEFLTLGSTPCDEACTQVGAENYRSLAQAECRRYRQMLETMFPDYEEHGCEFRMRSFYHEFGTYLEVIITYDDERSDSIEFAFRVESNLPDTWNHPSILATFARTGNLDHLNGYSY